MTTTSTSPALANIAVVRALGGIGDVLTAVPALKRLRHANPQSRITYIGLPQVEKLVKRYPALIDRFVAFPGFPGIIEQPLDPMALATFIDTQASSARYDLAIQMHGSGSVSNAFTALLSAVRMAGWHLAGLWCPDPAGFGIFPDRLPEVERWTTLMARIGFADGDASPEFPVHDAERWALSELAPGLAGTRYAVVHVGASDPRRRWPPERFSQIADLLSSRGLRVVLTGTAVECALVARVLQAMQHSALDLCGLTTLGEAGALIEGAELVVTNDTGTAHLAVALSTPSVVIFLASDPARWAAPDQGRHIAVGTGIGDPVVGRPVAVSMAEAPSVDDVSGAIDSLMAVA